MSTDDRDIESSNPSKNFKVGDFDQRSGFFTPVWESKRRIRSEPPAAPATSGSSKSARNPSSRSAQGEAEPAGGTAASKGKSGSEAPRARSTAASPATSTGKSRRSSPARSATPVPPSAAEGTPATLGAAPLPPAVAAVFDPAVELPPVADASSMRGDAPSAAPSAATRALQEAGPDLPPAAFLDPEPELRDAPALRNGASDERRERSPARERSPIHQRSLRASSAAARIHEQLKAKLQAEAAELDESRFERTPDSQLPPLPVQEHDIGPYPQSLLRRLRRTIRLSTPVPDRIRSLISKYDRG